MEEIKIYHSPWRMLLLALASLAFAVAGFFMTIHSPKGFHIIVGWFFLYGSQTVFIFCSKAFGHQAGQMTPETELTPRTGCA